MVSENNKLEEKLILENMALIRKVIKDLHLYWQTEDEFQEYYDVGLDGLIKGVRSYDEAKGKISTWCIPCIRNEILHLVTQKNYKKNKNEYGRDISLNFTINEDSEKVTEYGDLIPDLNTNVELEIEKKFEAERLLVAVNQLKNEKDKLVIKMYYGLEGYEPMIFRDIAEQFGCSDSAIQFRARRALPLLKKYLEKNDRDISIKRKTEKKEVFMIEQSKNTKKTNTLSNLNDILFAQLERLNDASNDDTTFEKEIRKSYATAQLAQQIVSNNNTCIKALKLAKEHKIDNCDQLKFIGLK